MLQVEKAQQLSTSQQELKKAAEDFESLFLQQMLSAMRKTIPESDLFGDRKAEEMFETMLDEEMSKNMAKAGGIGLSDMIYEQMVHFVSDKD